MNLQMKNVSNSEQTNSEYILKKFTVRNNNDMLCVEHKGGYLRWKISYPSTRRWLDRGNPRDAGEWYAC